METKKFKFRAVITVETDNYQPDYDGFEYLTDEEKAEYFVDDVINLDSSDLEMVSCHKTGNNEIKVRAGIYQWLIKKFY